MGSLGLASNLGGFLVLGGHGHSHGPGEEDEHDHEHSHSHDDVRAAEEGHSHGHSHSHDGAHDHADSVIPEPVKVAKKGSKKQKKDAGAHDHAHDHAQPKTTTSDDAASASISRAASKGSKKHRRSISSINRNRLSHDFSLHPSSFRQDIIGAASRMDGIQSEEASSADEDAIGAEEPSENSPLLTHKPHNHSHSHSHDHSHNHGAKPSGNGIKPRNDSWHANHNHKKPKKEATGHGGHNHADMGMRAMILHVAGDALGNVGVIVSALVIWLTTSPYRFYADPAVSLFITIIILHSTIPLTSATAKILLQATPDHLDVNDIKDDIQGIPGVVSCHHVHIWQLSDSQVVASMHIQVSFPISEEGGSERYMELAKTARECLHAYGIHSATIQPEFCLDKAHDHSGSGGLGVDGDGARDIDSDDCLLECVDDCTAKACCGPATEPTP